MTKGGARVASDEYAVGKGMGLRQHWTLLKEMERYGKPVSINEIRDILNAKHAWWDDGPNETCRSYLKEMWRQGFLDKIDKDGNSIALNTKNWSYGPRDYKYALTNLYRSTEIGDKPWLFPYCVGYRLIEAMEKGIFPQLEKILQLEKDLGYIPVNDEQTARISKEKGYPIEKHAGKAIKFGWLESTGIIFRIDKDKFKVDQDWLAKLEKYDYLPFGGVIRSLDGLEVNWHDEQYSVHMSNNDTIILQAEIINNTSERIKIDIKISPLFERRFSLDSTFVPFHIDPGGKNSMNVKISYRNHDYSDSSIRTHLGSLIATCEGLPFQHLTPEIDIRNEDLFWEIEVCDVLRELGHDVHHLTGKSDRPDAVIDLSGSSNPNLLEYLRDSSKDKLLMETTIRKYSASKLESDTIKKNARGLNKFTTHTTKVLKISAIGQLIVADYFAENIEEKLEYCKSKVTHPITLIDIDDLRYLAKVNRSRPSVPALRKILTSGVLITKDLIDTSF